MTYNVIVSIFSCINNKIHFFLHKTGDSDAHARNIRRKIYVNKNMESHHSSIFSSRGTSKKGGKLAGPAQLQLILTPGSENTIILFFENAICAHISWRGNLTCRVFCFRRSGAIQRILFVHFPCCKYVYLLTWVLRIKKCLISFFHFLFHKKVKIVY